MNKDLQDNKTEENIMKSNSIIQIPTEIVLSEEKEEDKKPPSKFDSPKKTLKKKLIQKVISSEDQDTQNKILNNNFQNKVPASNSEKTDKKVIKDSQTSISLNEDRNLEEVQNAVTNLKEKRNWKSWSPQEKILFYEIIANGGNYSSLQKLFKTMNDKIGTKSTEKIRDFYYRMLKNVNILLKRAGDTSVNSRNRDEVIAAISCYGKLLTSNSQKNTSLDMKKLNKHPRLYKKMANTLKKLITNKIKLVRLKMINGKQNTKSSLKYTINCNSQSNNNNQPLANPQITPPPFLKPMSLTFSSDFSRIINVASYRKIPYNDFLLRLTPFDNETYLKMIKMNYSCRLEIHITSFKSIKFIIQVLIEKWKNVIKTEPRMNLFLIPIRELWIPKELIYFSINDLERTYDIGDIFTAYGSPNTNILHMKYQWTDLSKVNLNCNGNIDTNNQKDVINNNNEINTNINNDNLNNNNNLTIPQLDSIYDSEYKSEKGFLNALAKQENKNYLNRSISSIPLNNGQNFCSNKAVKGEETQDLMDFSIGAIDYSSEIYKNKEKVNSNKYNNSIEENDKLNKLDEEIFVDNDNNLGSDQDSNIPLDNELIDPMYLLGLDEDNNNIINENNENVEITSGKINHNINIERQNNINKMNIIQNINDKNINYQSKDNIINKNNMSRHENINNNRINKNQKMIDTIEIKSDNLDKDNETSHLNNNISNEQCHQFHSPSISKKLQFHKKKIAFINNVNPNENIINSSFVNKSITNKSKQSGPTGGGIKLRTGYSDIFSNNNSINNNTNNLAYTSNNNLSEVSSHINNSNHYHTLNNNKINNNKKSEVSNANLKKEESNISNSNKDFLNNFGNVNEKIKGENDKMNEIEKDKEKCPKEVGGFIIIEGGDRDEMNKNKRKKKIKFVNNVSEEKSKELREKQEKEKEKKLVINISQQSLKKNNSAAQQFSFGSVNNSINSNSINNKNKEPNNNNNNTISKPKNHNNNHNQLTPTKNSQCQNKQIQGESSPLFNRISNFSKKNTSAANNNTNNNSLFNSHLNNQNNNNNLPPYSIGIDRANGISRIFGERVQNTNNLYGINLGNDSAPFLPQNTTNFNIFLENQTNLNNIDLFKSNFNNSNLGFINEDNQMSQIIHLNGNNNNNNNIGEERGRNNLMNSTLFGGGESGSKIGFGNINTNNNASNYLGYNNINNTSINMSLNNEYFLPQNNNLGEGNNNIEKNNDYYIANEGNINKNEQEVQQHGYLNKKRNFGNINSEFRKKNNNKDNSKRHEKNYIDNNNINNNFGLYSNNNNNVNNDLEDNKNNNNNRNINRNNSYLMNRNSFDNNNYYPQFLHGIDIPLPSRFLEESVNNYKK